MKIYILMIAMVILFLIILWPIAEYVAKVLEEKNETYLTKDKPKQNWGKYNHGVYKHQEHRMTVWSPGHNLVEGRIVQIQFSKDGPQNLIYNGSVYLIHKIDDDNYYFNCAFHFENGHDFEVKNVVAYPRAVIEMSQSVGEPFKFGNQTLQYTYVSTTKDTDRSGEQLRLQL